MTSQHPPLHGAQSAWKSCSSLGLHAELGELRPQRHRQARIHWRFLTSELIDAGRRRLQLAFISRKNYCRPQYLNNVTGAADPFGHLVMWLYAQNGSGGRSRSAQYTSTVVLAMFDRRLDIAQCGDREVGDLAFGVTVGEAFSLTGVSCTASVGSHKGTKVCALKGVASASCGHAGLARVAVQKRDKTISAIGFIAYLTSRETQLTRWK